MRAFDREKLDALVAEGWLRSQRHLDADLWIYNYTEKTQYEGYWSPETLACRGLILDAAGGIVARPFGKFFNLGDPQIGDLPSEPFRVTEKIDGSLGILYWLDGEPHIATRGSFTSEQAVEGTRMLREGEVAQASGRTLLFEIVYPENRIVVDYGERRELVALATIDNETAADHPEPVQHSFNSVPEWNTTGIDELARQDRPNCEGYVVAFFGGLRVKIKHAEYVRLHRIVTGINARSVWEALRAGDRVLDSLDGVPDEIYEWVDATAEALERDFAAREAAAQAVFRRRPHFTDRRQIAEYFTRSGGNTAVLFRMLDGKPYEDLIWKAIKPEPSTPETHGAEEVA
jgi:RNA ligase